MRYFAFVFLSLCSAVHAEQQINTDIENHWPNSRYIVHDDGTVTDTETSLMWLRCSWGQSGEDCTGAAQSHEWRHVLGVAQNSTDAGYSDWRVPNIKEISSLAALDRYNPAINLDVFPNTPPSRFASSTPNRLINQINFIYFNSGNIEFEDGRTSSHLRLVRTPD